MHDPAAVILGVSQGKRRGGPTVKTENLNKIVWLILGLVISGWGVLTLFAPLALAQDSPAPRVWLVGAATLVGSVALARYLGERQYRAFLDSEPETVFKCVGVAMAYHSMGGLFLGTLTLGVLFGLGMVLGLVHPIAGPRIVMLNSALLGGSYGVLMGIMAGLVVGGADAVRLSRGEKLEARTWEEKNPKPRRSKKKRRKK